MRGRSKTFCWGNKYRVGLLLIVQAQGIYLYRAAAGPKPVKRAYMDGVRVRGSRGLPSPGHCLRVWTRDSQLRFL